MNIKHSLKIFIILVFTVVVCFQTAAAQGIKERMKQRLPAIAELKSQGIVGENNQGYLGFVSGKKAMEDVVNAENKDRKAVYAYFAEQQNTTIDVVETVQAKRKAEKANPGEFFQTPEGKWVKK